MIVKTLILEIYINQANSLKDKRRIVKSIIARCRQKFNVSASELDKLDQHKKAVIGIVTITNNNAYADEVLDKCLHLIESEYSVEIITMDRDRS